MPVREGGRRAADLLQQVCRQNPAIAAVAVKTARPEGGACRKRRMKPLPGVVPEEAKAKVLLLGDAHRRRVNRANLGDLALARSLRLNLLGFCRYELGKG